MKERSDMLANTESNSEDTSVSDIATQVVDRPCNKLRKELSYKVQDNAADLSDYIIKRAVGG